MKRTRALVVAAALVALVTVGVGASSSSATTNGGFGQAIKITPPTDAGSTPDPSLSDVSCTSGGNCAGVGAYTDHSGFVQAMAATETNGIWARAVKVTPPTAANGTRASLSGVSCTSAGNCEGVGSYFDDISGLGPAMAATETNGIWAQATKIPPPPASADRWSLIHLSCPSAGNCVGVGVSGFTPGSSQPFSATETNGTWGQVTDITAPSDAFLGSISCPSTGSCEAVGSYRTMSGSSAMAVTETNGTWGQATMVTDPDAPSHANADLRGVSCTSSGNCQGVGGYSDSSGNGQAMAATETNGTWSQAIKVTPPADSRNNPFAGLGAVSCTSVGNCRAVGAYEDTSNNGQAIAVSETDGAWGQAIKVTPPADAGTNPKAFLGGVSCPSAGGCTGVGGYTDTSGHSQAMAASEAPPPMVANPASSPQFGIPNQTDVFDVASNGAVEVHWVDGGGAWQGPLAISKPGLAPPGAHLAVSNQFGIPDQTDVFVVGTDGATKVLWVQGHGAWQGPLGITPARTAPAGVGVAASNQFGVPDQTDVFVVGTDGATKVSWVQGGSSWHGPLTISKPGLAPPGARLAVSNQFGIPDQTDVFVVGTDGATKASWVQSHGAWHGPLGITPAGTAPAGAGVAASNQFGIPDQTDVFVVGDDGATRVSWVQGSGAWHGPLGITPAGTAPAGAGVAASNQFGIPDQTDVFVVGKDGAIRVTWVQGRGVWHGPVGITPPSTAPSGTALAAGPQFGVAQQTDVFVVSSGETIDVSWVQGAGAWKGPVAI